MALVATEREGLIQRYADGPAKLRAALAKVPAEALQFRPAPGEWSAHEIVVHCSDSETNAHMRIRYVTLSKEALISGYDQDDWAREADYHAHPLDVALTTVDAVRANTTALIRRLPESAWSRSGLHTEHDRPYTAETWLEIYAEHLEVHAAQIEANLEAWRAKQKG